MKINISNLSEGVHNYEFEESPSSVNLDDRFSKQVLVTVELEKRRRQLFLTAHIKTTGKFVCDRCLEEFEREVVTDYKMAYVYDPIDTAGFTKSKMAHFEDEVTVLHPSTNEIFIDEDVRQYILISVPLKLLCKEDCAGLCETCGRNLNNNVCDCVKKSSPNIIIKNLT
jgi:uncharacterized protein